MNKEQLTREVAVSQGLHLSTACKAVDGVLNAISQALTKGDKVKLKGFGTFRLVKVGQRQVGNFNTGQTITIPEHMSVRFKSGKNILQKPNMHK